MAQPRSFSIDILAVSDALDLNDPGIAEDFVHDTVISDAEAIGALGTSELM